MKNNDLRPKKTIKILNNKENMNNLRVLEDNRSSKNKLIQQNNNTSNMIESENYS